MLTADGDSVRLVVDRPYKAGEPIIVWYYVFLQLHNCINIRVLPHDILQSECSSISVDFVHCFWYMHSRPQIM